MKTEIGSLQAIILILTFFSFGLSIDAGKTVRTIANIFQWLGIAIIWIVWII